MQSHASRSATVVGDIACNDFSLVLVKLSPDVILRTRRANVDPRVVLVAAGLLVLSRGHTPVVASKRRLASATLPVRKPGQSRELA